MTTPSSPTPPPETTNWGLVALTAGLSAAVIGAFLWALQHAGKAARSR